MKKQKWFDKKFRFDLPQDQLHLVLKKLAENPENIVRLVSSLPEKILKKRVENKWSIKENVGHLIDLEELHVGRIDDFIAGREKLRSADLNNKKTEDANHNEKNIGELLNQLKLVRENFVRRMKELDEKVLSSNAIHPRLSQPMRPIDMAQFVLEHDEHHIETIKDLIDKLQ